MRYHQLGQIPPKRHSQFRVNGSGNGTHEEPDPCWSKR